MRIMGRSKGRARRYAIDKAYNRGAAAAFATANRSAEPRRVALGDAINALTAGDNRRGMVIDDETRWMARDPRDEVPFGPINPLRPDAIDPVRPDTGRPEPRLTEYPVAWNLPGSADAPMPWSVLRAAAQNVDIMRRCISIRQEQLQGLDWSITLDDQTVQGMHAASAGGTGREDIEAELRRKLLPEIDRLTTFWRNPWKANGVSFEQWVNGIMEDHLVLDAVAIYPRTTYGGELCAFELIDATTIKLLIDYRGARPEAPFPAFQQILYGFPRAEFGSCYAPEGDDGVKPAEGMLADQLFYFREQYRSFTPYGYSAVAQALISARLYLRRQGWMLAEYDDGSTPLTFLVPDATDASMVEKLTYKTRRQWEDSINSELAGQTRARNRMKVLMPGMTPHQMQGVDERYKPDYDMHLIKMLAGHFGVTSSGLGFSESRGLGNSGLHEGQADVQQAATTKPDKRMIERIVNELMCTYQGAPAELRFKFTDPDTEDQAAEDAAANAQRARGTITLNDDRKRLGKSPFPFPEADMPLALIGTGWVPIEGMAARAEQAAEAEQALVEDQLATGEMTREQAATEAEEVSGEDATKALELAAYTRWARKRGGAARRPFVCKALSPSDWPGEQVPGDVDFAEWEWVPDGLADDVTTEDIAKAFGGNDNWRTLARDSRGRWVKRGSMRVDALGPSTPDKPVIASLRADAERRRAAAAAPKPAARQLPVSDASSTMDGMTTPANLPPNPAIKTREQRVAELNAGMAAAMSGGAPAKGSVAERIMARQDASVRDVVTSLQDAPGGWVSMVDVRRKLQAEHGMDRGQQDAALRRLVTTGDRDLVTAPEDNQKTLTDADHAAAVDFGAGPQHVVMLEPPRRSVLDTVRESSEQAAAASAVIDSVPGLREGVARQQGVKGPKRLPDAQHNAVQSIAERYAHNVATLDTASTSPMVDAADLGIRPATADALVKSGLLERRVLFGFQRRYRLTDAGHAYLAEHTGDTRRAELSRGIADLEAQRETLNANRTAYDRDATNLSATVNRQQRQAEDQTDRMLMQQANALRDERAKLGVRSTDDGPVTVREEGRQNNPGFALPATPPAARAEAVAASTPDAPSAGPAEHPQKAAFDKLLDGGIVKHKQTRQIIEQMEAHGWKLTQQDRLYGTTSWEAPDGRTLGIQHIDGAKPRIYANGATGRGDMTYRAALAHVVTPTHQEVGGPNVRIAAERVSPELGQRVRAALSSGGSDDHVRRLDRAQRELSGYGSTPKRSVADIAAGLRADADWLEAAAQSNAEHHARIGGFGESDIAARQRREAGELRAIADVMDQQAAERAAYEAEVERRASLPLDIRPTSRGTAKPAPAKRAEAVAASTPDAPSAAPRDPAELTGQAYRALLATVGEGGRITHPQSRKIVETMERGGWRLADVKPGMSEWKHEDGRRITMLSGADKPTFMASGRKLTGKAALEHVESDHRATQAAIERVRGAKGFDAQMDAVKAELERPGLREHTRRELEALRAKGEERRAALRGPEETPEVRMERVQAEVARQRVERQAAARRELTRAAEYVGDVMPATRGDGAALATRLGLNMFNVQSRPDGSFTFALSAPGQSGSARLATFDSARGGWILPGLGGYAFDANDPVFMSAWLHEGTKASHLNDNTKRAHKVSELLRTAGHDGRMKPTA